MESLPTTQKDAKRMGSRRYFTGRPCKNGHLCERHARNGDCVQCRREHKKRNEQRHPERQRERKRRWRIKWRHDPERERKRMMRYLVYYAIRTGVLTPTPCKYCGASKVEAHHPDYSKPLEVEWVCRPCHHKIHLTLTPKGEKVGVATVET